MENHLHLIASASDLSKEIASFKSYTARSIIDFLMTTKHRAYLKQLAFHKAAHKADRQYQLWQEGSHPQQIQNLEMMEQKANYIHQNPVRRGYVEEPTYWRYSSARNYVGTQGMVEVQTEWA